MNVVSEFTVKFTARKFARKKVLFIIVSFNIHRRISPGISVLGGL